MTDWTAPDAPAPLTDDDFHQAAVQWKELARQIRTPPVPATAGAVTGPSASRTARNRASRQYPRPSPEPGRDVW